MLHPNINLLSCAIAPISPHFFREEGHLELRKILTGKKQKGHQHKLSIKKKKSPSLSFICTQKRLVRRDVDYERRKYTFFYYYLCTQNINKSNIMYIADDDSYVCIELVKSYDEDAVEYGRTGKSRTDRFRRFFFFFIRLPLPPKKKD